MHKSFDLMNGILREVTKAMVERLKTGLKNDTFSAFPNEKEINPIYPIFEIFSYLLFQLDFFVVMYQEQKIRKPLFNSIADDMLQTLDMEKKTFNSILN